MVVSARAADGAEAKLDLQVKRTLTLSAAASNQDFRSIVVHAWHTIAAPGFQADRDRVGAVTGQIASDSRRALEAICEWARNTSSPALFLQHFDPGVANDSHRAIRDAVRTLLAEADPALGDDALFKFFRHFVLVTFDFLHEGAATPASQVPLLRAILADSDKPRAPDLWQRLQRMAREAAGAGASLDRATLLLQLHGAFRFLAAPSLRADLAVLAESSARVLAEIENTIAGLSLPRPTVDAALEAALANCRYAQIVGLPRTGKSAALRAFAQARASQGPVLVLKADRLDGASWAAYATALGLQTRLLKPLLQELGAVGVQIVFIDGLDRIEIANRGVVNDILNLLATDPDLEGWRVVATVRDNGVEPLRTWLSPGWTRNRTAVVDVPSFDDEEADQIATQRPSLRPLLFGQARVRESPAGRSFSPPYQASQTARRSARRST